MRKIELLAPAGDRESAFAAVRFGADAVYLGGGMLQLRAGKTAFTLEEMRGVSEMLHKNGKKLYVTANAFVFPNEIRALGDYARALKDVGVDAAIVSDLGGIIEIKRACPELEVHVSTQANCTNHVSARAYYDMGAARVVLSRELSLEQIAEMRQKTPKELTFEAFVHGAMCVAYSGRCLLSNYLTGRSANRGGCAQSCRWKYALTEEKRPGQYFPIEEDERGTTILSSYDMCALPVLEKLIDAGVDSLKIEGRMKTAYYVATTVNAYRMYLDGAKDFSACMAELNSASHRPYSTGFYEGEIKTMPHAPEGYLRDLIYSARVLSREGDRIHIELKNKIEENDMLRPLTPNLRAEPFSARDMRDADGNPVTAAKMPDAVFTLPAPEGIEAGDYIRSEKPAE